jgi:hypothetical protein
MRAQSSYTISAQGMAVSFSRLMLWIGIILGLGAVYGSSAGAATPTPYLQDSTIVGSGATLTITNVPVQTSTGSIVYKDITIVFDAAVGGHLSIAAGYPQEQPAISPILSNFVAGNYAGPPTFVKGNFLVTVKGPGVGPGGATVWSLITSSGADNCTYPPLATWYTGPIASNPLAPRLTKIGLASTFYSYGVVGAGSNCNDAGVPFDFPTNGLIGVSQVEGSLTIVSFTTADLVDQATPVAEITYTLLP